MRTGEQVNSSVSLPRPKSCVVVSSHDGEGNKISADVSQAHSEDPPPHPGPCQQTKATNNNSQRKGVG